MSTLRIPVAIATSVVALAFARTSSADEPPKQEPAHEVQRQEQPKSVTVQPAPSEAQRGTTITTSGPYTISTGPTERVAERTMAHRPNRPLLSTGTGLFVLSYGASVAAGAMSPRDADKRLFIPVAGPWLDLANRECTPRTPCGENEDVAKAMLLTSGIVQGASVLFALGAFIIPETTTIEEKRAAAKALKPEVRIVPVSFAAGAGIGAVGRF